MGTAIKRLQRNPGGQNEIYKGRRMGHVKNENISNELDVYLIK